MSLLSKLQPIIILFSALIGLALGMLTPFGNVSINVVEIFLMLLLYILFLSIDMKELKKAALNVKYTSTSAFINFILTPIVAYILGLLFFENSTDIRIGLLMLLVTPCTDWYLVFTKLSKGNIELNMSILPLNLILQVFLMPVYLFVFMGSAIEIKIDIIAKSIAIVLFIPFLCAMLTRIFLVEKTKIQEKISNNSDNLQLSFLCLAIVAMFASEGQNLLEHPLLLMKFFIPLMCFFGITFFAVKLIGSFLKFNNEDTNALHMTTLARNSPLALAIAVSAFPNAPLISLALIIGPLIELPILSFISAYLGKKIK